MMQRRIINVCRVAYAADAGSKIMNEWWNECEEEKRRNLGAVGSRA